MAFESFTDFVAMGGHGLFVWLAYAIGIAVVLFNVISPKLIQKQLIEDQKRRLRREQS